MLQYFIRLKKDELIEIATAHLQSSLGEFNGIKVTMTIYWVILYHYNSSNGSGKYLKRPIIYINSIYMG